MNAGAAPVDLDDTLAVVGYGAEVLDDALDARLAQALDHAPAAALVARLEDLRRAMQADTPRAARRGTGLLGRLLGRDVQAEAQAAHLRERIGVLLLQTDRDAGALRTRAATQHALQAEVDAAMARIGERIASARTWLDAHPDAGAGAGVTASPRQRLQQRLDQLVTVQAAWSIAAGQLALLHEQTLGLLARYQRIRDVLLPSWRQHALGDAARTGGADAMRAAQAQAAIETEVAAMAGTLDPQSASTQAPE